MNGGLAVLASQWRDDADLLRRRVAAAQAVAVEGQL